MLHCATVLRPAAGRQPASGARGVRGCRPGPGPAACSVRLPAGQPAQLTWDGGCRAQRQAAQLRRPHRGYRRHCARAAALGSCRVGRGGRHQGGGDRGRRRPRPHAVQGALPHSPTRHCAGHHAAVVLAGRGAGRAVQRAPRGVAHAALLQLLLLLVLLLGGCGAGPDGARGGGAGEGAVELLALGGAVSGGLHLAGACLLDCCAGAATGSRVGGQCRLGGGRHSGGCGRVGGEGAGWGTIWLGRRGQGRQLPACRGHAGDVD